MIMVMSTLFSAMQGRAGRPSGANQSSTFGLSWAPWGDVMKVANYKLSGVLFL